jgi:hypothetical protein
MFLLLSSIYPLNEVRTIIIILDQFSRYTTCHTNMGHMDHKDEQGETTDGRMDDEQAKLPEGHVTTGKVQPLDGPNSFSIL